MNGVLQLLFFNDWCPVFSGAVFLLLDYRLFAFTLFYSVKEFCLKSVNTWQRYHRQYGVSFFCWTWCRPIISVRSDCLFHDLSTYSFSRGNDAVLFFLVACHRHSSHIFTLIVLLRVFGNVEWEKPDENPTGTGIRLQLENGNGKKRELTAW